MICRGGQQPVQSYEARWRLGVDLHDLVTLSQTGLCCRAAGLHPSDSHRSGTRFELRAEPQGIQHFGREKTRECARDLFYRNGETNTNAALALFLAINGDVQADQFSAEIDEQAPATSAPPLLPGLIA